MARKIHGNVNPNDEAALRRELRKIAIKLEECCSGNVDPGTPGMVVGNIDGGRADENYTTLPDLNGGNAEGT
jgi:hypothetical protein